MAFEDIPFSEIEARLMAMCPGGWRNFDDIEDALSIDELLLLVDMTQKVRHEEFKFQASLQGVDLGGDEDLDMTSVHGELPDEIYEAERAWQEKKAAALASGEAEEAKSAAFNIGYVKK